jgi:hypothetical protein
MKNMHKLSVPNDSLNFLDIREYLIGVAANHRINQLTFFGLNNKSVFTLLQKLKRPKNVIDFHRAVKIEVLAFIVFKDYRLTLCTSVCWLISKASRGCMTSWRMEFIDLNFIPRVDNKEGGDKNIH